MFPWYANFESIRFVVDAYMCDNFIEISQTDQILTLDEKEMLWLFDNPDIKASEATMLHCLIRWYQHQKTDRERVFKDLFFKIHLSMIPRDYLWGVIKKYKLLKVMPELTEYKHDGLKLVGLTDGEALYQQYLGNIAVIQTQFENTIFQFFNNCAYLTCHFPFSQNLLHNQRTYGLPSRKSKIFFVRQKCFVFSVLSKSRLGIKGYCFNAGVNEFPRLCRSCPLRLSNWISSVHCGMYIFFLGCFKAILWFQIPTDAVYRYDTVNDEWKNMAPLPYTYRSQPLTVCFKDRYIFLFDNQRSEKYDIYTNKWSAIRPIPAGMIRSTGRQVDNKIFILYYGKKPRMVSKCFMYDPLLDTWEELKNLKYLDRLIVRKPLLDIQTFFGKVFVLSRDERKHTLIISEIDIQQRKMKYLCEFEAASPMTHVVSNICMVMFNRGWCLKMYDSQRGGVEFSKLY